MREFPYLRTDENGLPFSVKVRMSDFEVEEIPAYQPCGEGEHLYLKIEKTGISTMNAVRNIAKAYALSDRAIGVAGLKDARGVSRQTVSLHMKVSPLPEYPSIPGVKILDAQRHTNKLRIGHLWGNLFSLKLRNISDGETPLYRDRFENISSKGIPNYFGIQRFGNRQDTWEIGQAIVKKDFDEARRIAGRNNLRDNKKIGFYVNAFQSWMFNHFLAKRMPDIDKLEKGDLAYRHDNGAVFRVENPGLEQPRADKFEISPSGPLFGHKMTRATGRPGELENEILAMFCVEPEDFREKSARRMPGSRRPLRVKPKDCLFEEGVDGEGPYLKLSFGLPAGSYATSLLRELGKEKMDYVQNERHK